MYVNDIAVGRFGHKFRQHFAGYIVCQTACIQKGLDLRHGSFQLCLFAQKVLYHVLEFHQLINDLSAFICDLTLQPVIQLSIADSGYNICHKISEDFFKHW